MSQHTRPLLKRIFNRRVAKALLYLAMVLSVALTLGLAGTDVVGHLANTGGWMQARTGHFLAWRLFLYAVAARTWWSFRRRLLQRNASQEMLQHLIRTEIAIMQAIALLEGVLFVQNL